MKTFPTSAVWCFGILFISVSLITTGSSEVQVVGPADRVVALAGDDVILPCSLKPNVSAEDMAVEWTGLYLKTRNVHLYRQGRDSNEEQFTSYRGRTSMFHEELKNSNFSLKLTRVTLSDAGSYRCFIPTLTSQVKNTTVQLFVDHVFSWSSSLIMYSAGLPPSSCIQLIFLPHHSFLCYRSCIQLVFLPYHVFSWSSSLIIPSSVRDHVFCWSVTLSVSQYSYYLLLTHWLCPNIPTTYC
uniref:Ig-like domain-containing protein n=1 Tax=Oncorhynchus mykiss TaxID=8022 RepID=A0A8C7T3A7_ONCMY